MQVAQPESTIDVKDEYAAGIHKETNTREGACQRFRSCNIAYAVKTAHGRVDSPIQVKLLHTLAEVNRRNGTLRYGMSGSNGEHLQRRIHGNDFISRCGKAYTHSTGAAGKVKYQLRRNICEGKKPLIKPQYVVIRHITVKFIVIGCKRTIGFHLPQASQ